MRKEAALLIVLAVIGFSAAPACATPIVAAHWSLDEGFGQVAADSGPNGLGGRLGSSDGADAADPAWTTGHTGGPALAFAGGQYVAVPDSAALEPAHVTVDAWVRRSGSPGIWRYVVSKGAVGCERSAYGLYSGWAGGMSFYVSSATQYTLSPEAPATVVWDGAWHHVIGAYDGARVRLWIDGAQVGDGTATTLPIAYGIGSKELYLGTYRGSCELGFKGDIDDVQIVGDGTPPDPGLPVIQPTPGTPTRLPIPGGGATTPSQQSSTAPKACL
jgi:Concanavalin A-like lectin/glucanases superfamily